MKIRGIFSHRKRRPKPPAPFHAWQALDEGDVPGDLRQLRHGTEDLPLDELALVVARAAGSTNFDDLRTAADASAARPDPVS
ncbi:hypothetical protein ABTZ21_12800 [Streptomyces sp. NPDC096191]|uniref:hypothetical protein n=1 Tax=Streptomyces sp. NPDC096191 TaxID=3155426 RepID=UPI003322EFD2